MLRRALNGYLSRESTHASGLDLLLPLHVKNVSRIDWVRADNLVLKYPDLRERWNHAKRLVFDHETLASLAQRLPPRQCGLLSELTEDDIRLLVERGHIRAIDPKEAKAWVRTFSVVEVEKNRRRFIAAPELNDVAGPPGEIDFPLPTSLTEAFAHPAALQFDVPWYYGQMGIPEATQRFFCFTAADNVTYALQTVPTGYRHVVELAQTLTTAFARSVVDTAKPGLKAVSNTTPTHCSVYLDNVRFADSPEVLNSFIPAIREVAASITLQIDDLGEVTIEYDFLGIHFNHATRTTSITEKTRRKLLQARQTIDENLSLRGFLKILGLLMWCKPHTPVPLTRFYYALKFVRRRCHYAKRWALDAPCRPWEVARQAIHEWLNALLSAAPREHHKSSSSPWTLITDASLEGFGVIAIHDDRVAMILAGEYARKEHIAILELRAVKYGIDNLVLLLSHRNTPSDTPTEVNLIVDNTSVIGRLRRGYCAAYAANNVIDQILQTTRTNNMILKQIQYCKSEYNAADWWSRVGVNFLFWAR